MIIVISGFRDAEELPFFVAYQMRLARLFDFLLKKQQPHHLIVIEGGARGVDFLAGRLADARGCGHATVYASWKHYGPGGGPLRNEWMLSLKPNKVYGLHHDWPNSKGTANCIGRAVTLGIKTKMITVKL